MLKTMGLEVEVIVGHPGRDDWYPVDPAKCFENAQRAQLWGRH